jgi:DNA-binding beta-propeller fold protein YncE
VDSHGATLTKHARYLWVADRAANRIVVVDTGSDAVVNEIALAGSVSADPAPDLMGISPSGNRVYVSLRGPNPLTANVPGVNNAVGSTPGVGILRVTRGGRSGRLQAVAPISHMVGGNETADPHGLAVRVTNEADSDDDREDSDDDRD